MAVTKLQKKIMRRVYYAYAIRLLTLPGVPQGFMMLGTLIALTYFVSIGNVLVNMESVGLRGAVAFLYNAVTNTEAWTLLLIGIMIFSVLSFRFTIHTFTPRVFAKV